MNAYLSSCLFDEIIPSLDMDRAELLDYAQNVLVRFSNPYIKHYLASISLNSISKFRVRVLPSILSYREKFGKIPSNLAFSMARLLEFYKKGTPKDSEDVIAYIRDTDIADILANAELWGEDLSFLYNEVSKA